MNRERIGLEVVGLTAIILWLASYAEVIAERTAALVLAVVGAAMLADFVHRSVRDAIEAGRRHVAAPFAAIVASLALLPVATSLAPGEPLIEGELHQGEHLPLPAEARGTLRVVVHTDLATESREPIAYALAGLPEPITGHFEWLGDDDPEHPNAHDTDVQSVDLDGAGDLYLRTLHGPERAALEVTVFRERWPLQNELWLALMSMIAAGLLSLRHRQTASLFPVVLGATLFGVLIVRWLTPVAPLGQEVSAITVASLIGAACYAPWRWVVERRARREVGATSTS